MTGWKSSVEAARVCLAGFAVNTIVPRKGEPKAINSRDLLTLACLVGVLRKGNRSRLQHRKEFGFLNVHSAVSVEQTRRVSSERMVGRSYIGRSRDRGSRQAPPNCDQNRRAAAR